MQHKTPKPANPFKTGFDQVLENVEANSETLAFDDRLSGDKPIDAKILEKAARETGGYRISVEQAPPKIDGRSLRAKGRTKQFATKVTPESHLRLMLYVDAQPGGVADFLDMLMKLYDPEGAIFDRLLQDYAASRGTQPESILSRLK